MNNNQIIKRSPSNIAIVKYWGKHGNQLPNNPSLSFTLSNCFTETKVTFKNSDSPFSFDFYFEGKENPAFKAKIEKYLQENKEHFSFLEGLYLKIESQNSNMITGYGLGAELSIPIWIISIFLLIQR